MIQKLAPETLKSVTGGSVDPGGGIGPKCKHPNKYRIGADREDSRAFIWSQHQYEYFCPDCNKTFWVDEER